MTDWYERPVLTDAGLVGVDPRLRLEPLTVDHASAFMAAAADHADEVFRHLSYAPPTTRDQATEIIKRLTAANDSVCYAQIVAETGEFAGVTSLYDINPCARAVAIGGTWVAHRWWRSWLNTTSKLIMLHRVFEQLGAERVVWHTDIRNDRSQQAITRLGAIREGVLRHHKIRRDGSWRDTVQFSMLAEEWPAAKDRLRRRLTADHGIPSGTT